MDKHYHHTLITALIETIASWTDADKTARVHAGRALRPGGLVDRKEPSGDRAAAALAPGGATPALLTCSCPRGRCQASATEPRGLDCRRNVSQCPFRAPAGARSTVDEASEGLQDVAKARRAQARTAARQEGRARLRPAQVLPVLQGQDRAGRLQGRRDPAPVRLRARQDPLAADQRRLPAPPEPARHRGQARARDRAAALRERRPRGAPRARRAGGRDREREER